MHPELIQLLKTTFPDYSLDYEALLEKPKTAEHGDIALPVFSLAKELRKSPMQIAGNMVNELEGKLPSSISEVNAVGPYVNFRLDEGDLAKRLLDEVSSKKLFSPDASKQTVLLEWPSPNSNKPLHIGHGRNMLMGKSLSALLTKTGAKVIRVNLNNDRGIAICKSMLMYKLFGEGKTPESANRKSDYFVGDFYLMFETKSKENPAYETQAQEMLQQWEAGDKEVLALWETMNAWAFKGHNATYATFGVEHDKAYYESEIYKKGKDTILAGLEKELFYKDEENGNIVCDLEDKGFGQKVLLRGDGTSIYMTQDIALAKEKVTDFGACDKYVFVVGNEQAYHFNVLFEVLSRLGFGDTNKFYHFAYGMIELPEGKMSSRKGNVIFADELVTELTAEAKENLLSRELTANLAEEELQRRSHAIAMGALSFFILKFNPLSNFVFSKKEALSFEGETGPYLMYTYARIQSILRKEQSSVPKNLPASLEEKTTALIKVLLAYREMLSEAAKSYKVSSVALYLIKIAQAYNEFYHACPILKSEGDTKVFRLYLSDVTAQVLQDGMSLLGIPVLEEM
jgi:arginyl-tRNA synthetase